MGATAGPGSRGERQLLPAVCAHAGTSTCPHLHGTGQARGDGTYRTYVRSTHERHDNARGQCYSYHALCRTYHLPRPAPRADVVLASRCALLRLRCGTDHSNIFYPHLSSEMQRPGDQDDESLRGRGVVNGQSAVGTIAMPRQRAGRVNYVWL